MARRPCSPGASANLTPASPRYAAPRVRPPDHRAPPGPRPASASARRRPTARRSSRPRARGVRRYGLRRGTVRDIVRRTDLASGTFYNYFPDKEAVLRTLVDEIAVEARAASAPRGAAATTRGVRRATATAPTSSSWPEDPSTFALMRRNAGTIRALFDEPVIGAGISELRADLEAGVAAGALPPHDIELMAAAMVGAASRSAWRCSSGAPRRRALGGVRHRALRAAASSACAVGGRRETSGG